MKKASALILASFTAMIILLTFAVFTGMNADGGSLRIHSVEAGKSPAAVHPSESDTESRLVDINTADLSTLMTLPGIGQTLAERIIQYRLAHGPFESVAGLLNVEGIGAGKLESILGLITTGGTT